MLSKQSFRTEANDAVLTVSRFAKRVLSSSLLSVLTASAAFTASTAAALPTNLPAKFQMKLSSPFPPGFLTRAETPHISNDDIPIESNAAVRKWVYFFTHENRNRFDRFMTRGGRYRILVQDILEQNDVPPEMFYLGMIESGLRVESAFRRPCGWYLAIYGTDGSPLWSQGK